MTDAGPSAFGDTSRNEEEVALEAVLPDQEVDREIDRAVRGRRATARRYVRWVRRRHPNLSPAQVVALLERHYVTAISAAGAAVTVGGIAAEVGIAMIPVVGPVAAGGKASAKAVAKSVAVGVAKTGSQTVVSKVMPAGDEQIQFEITALFALALAEIHSMDLDQAQARVLVYGLSNERVSQQRISEMAKDLKVSKESGVAATSAAIAGGRGDWGHWADTLAVALPGEAAQTLMRGIQTGTLEGLRGALGGKQQAAVEYGVGALVGGVTRFAFGREVVEASHTAFPQPPQSFPDALAIHDKADEAGESNRALDAMTRAADVVGARLSTSAAVVGTGVVTAASVVSKPFRRVDVDGDGVPDEAKALTTAKGVGRAISSAAGSARSKLIRRGDRDKPLTP